MEHFFKFFYAQAPNSAGANAFCNLALNWRWATVIKMSLKPNERYDLNSSRGLTKYITRKIFFKNIFGDLKDVLTI